MFPNIFGDHAFPENSGTFWNHKHAKNVENPDFEIPEIPVKKQNQSHGNGGATHGGGTCPVKLKEGEIWPPLTGAHGMGADNPRRKSSRVSCENVRKSSAFRFCETLAKKCLQRQLRTCSPRVPGVSVGQAIGSKSPARTLDGPDNANPPVCVPPHYRGVDKRKFRAPTMFGNI